MTSHNDEYLHNVRRTLERGLKMAQADMSDFTEIDKRQIDVVIGRYADVFQHALDELALAGIKPPKD